MCVFVKIIAIIIPENGAKVSKIKCFQFAQQTLIKIIKEPDAKTQSQQFVRITLADYWLFLNPASCKADQQDSLWEKENEKPICFPFPYIS